MGRTSWGFALGALAAAVMMCGLPSVASAQPDRVATKLVPERSGWFFGASIGRGELDIDVGCSSCPSLKNLEEALSLSAHAGVMLNPSLGVLVEGWMVRFYERDNLRFADSSDHEIAETMLLGSGQVWLGRMFLRAGVGMAWHKTDLEYPVNGKVFASDTGKPPMNQASDMAPAGAVTLGLEAARTPTFSLELMVRAGAAKHARDVEVGTMALTLGGSWY